MAGTETVLINPLANEEAEPGDHGLLSYLPDRMAAFIGSELLHRHATLVKNFKDRDGVEHTVAVLEQGNITATVDMTNPSKVLADTVKHSDLGFLNRYVQRHEEKGFWEPIAEMTTLPEDARTGNDDSDAFVSVARAIMRLTRASTDIKNTIGRVRTNLGRDKKAMAGYKPSIALDAERANSHYEDLRFRRLAEGILGGEPMFYTASLWDSNTGTLEQANRNKQALLLRELNLDKLGEGDEILDLGAGWGPATQAILEANDKVHVTALVTSEDQRRFLEEKFADRPYRDRLTIVRQDYREHAKENPGRYKRIFSLEVNEHTPWQELRTSFVDGQMRMLAEDGEVIVQAVMVENERYDAYKHERDGFITEEVFPGHRSHCHRVIVDDGFEAAGMRLVSMYNLTDSYAKTFNEWRRNADNMDMSDEAYRWRDEMEEHRFWIAYLGGTQAALLDGYVIDRFYRLTQK